MLTPGLDGIFFGKKLDKIEDQLFYFLYNRGNFLKGAEIMSFQIALEKYAEIGINPLDALETLKKIAVDNARNVAPDAEVVLDEERRINGNTASIMGITGTIDGIPFRYHSFYWTGEKGCVQVITYTSQNLFAEYHDDFNDLLSGIVLNQ